MQKLKRARGSFLSSLLLFSDLIPYGQRPSYNTLYLSAPGVWKWGGDMRSAVERGSGATTRGRSYCHPNVEVSASKPKKISAVRASSALVGMFTA